MPTQYPNAHFIQSDSRMNTIVSNPPRTWHYLVAIAIPALVMIIALGLNNIRDYQQLKNTQTELSGLSHLTPLFDLSMTLQKIRGITQLQRHGEGNLNSEIAQLKKQLSNQINTLKNSPRSIELGIDEELKQLDLQTKYTLDASEINTPQEIFLSHSALVNHSLDIIKKSAENSMLAFDDDPNIYFLTKLIIYQISDLSESLGRVRGIGGGFILNERLGNSRQFTQELHTLKNNLNIAHRSTMRAVDTVADDEKRIIHLMSLLFQISDKFITKSEKLLNGEKLQITAQGYFSEGSRAIEQSMRLYADSEKLLNKRLQARLSKIQTSIYLTVGGELTAILTMAFFIILFYRKNTTAFKELQSSIDSLYDSEAKNRAIINHSVDGIITINQRGIILSANSAAEKLFGYNVPEMVGNNLDMLMSEPHQSGHDSYLSRYLGTGKRKMIGIGRETEGMRKNGTLFPIELSVSEAPHKGERIFTGTIHDISAHKAIELELMQYKNHLEFLVEDRTIELNTLHDELKQFTHIASHDLMIQIPVIKENSEKLAALFRNKNTPPDKTVQAVIEETITRVNTIIQASNQLEWEIEALIKLSHAGLQKLQPEYVDMEIIAHNLKKIAGPELKNKNAHINIGSLPVISTDRKAVEQIISSLLDNAIKHLLPGRPGIIEINAETHDDCCLFYIRDNGKALADDEIPQVFNPFQKQDKETLTHDSIGLAYVMYLTRRLGGSLNCQSTPGEGSLFSISLPARNNKILEIDYCNNQDNHSDLDGTDGQAIAS
ncbi:MAG: PAS domain-containing sensor histidine kinase [Gammaproteobacteria bacterium]|nr:PAS domain-containing sensor histidine kinase [Gammaproteobacteria bacterium]